VIRRRRKKTIQGNTIDQFKGKTQKLVPESRKQRLLADLFNPEKKKGQVLRKKKKPRSSRPGRARAVRAKDVQRSGNLRERERNSGENRENDGGKKKKGSVPVGKDRQFAADPKGRLVFTSKKNTNRGEIGNEALQAGKGRRAVKERLAQRESG